MLICVWNRPKTTILKNDNFIDSNKQNELQNTLRILKLLFSSYKITMYYDSKRDQIE